MAADKITVTYFKPRGLFKKCIGKRRGEDGKVTPAIFWLGHDQRAAERAARRIIELIPKQGALDSHGVWTEDGLAQAQTEITVAKEAWSQIDLLPAILAPERPAPPPKPIPVTKPEGKTLYNAIEAYLKHIAGKTFSDSHKERAGKILDGNLKSARKDCPLSDIDYLWIDQMADYFKARPKSRKGGKTISAHTVLSILRYIRTFFVWLDDTGYGGWEGPRKLMKPFKVRLEDLLTTKERREATVIRQFDIPTLVKLYRRGSDFQKMIMLMGVFCGLTQQELAVLTRDEFDLENQMLQHFRNKTGIEGRFWLPGELVALLRSHFAQRPNDSLAFRGSDGNPLVIFKDGRQSSDTVRQMWDDLRTAAKVPNALTFKFLRKYLADYCTLHGGEEMGQIAMAHSSQTVLGRNYTKARRFDSFHELQRGMYAKLKAAGMFELAEHTEATAA